MSAAQSTQPAVAGLLAGIALLSLAFACAGAGHGTYLPFGVFGAPLSLVPRVWLVSPVIMWAFFGVAVARRSRMWLGCLALSHVLGLIGVALKGTPVEGATEQWRHVADSGLLTVIAFLAYALAAAALVYSALGIWLLSETPPSR